MDLHRIPIVAVSYNSPELLFNLLSSLRRYYANPVHIVDGSEAGPLVQIRELVARFEGVQLHAHGYNIHHGPGMAWAIETLPLGPIALFLDTDIVVLKAGFLEDLLARLQPQDYGVGGVAYINRDGFDIPYGYGAIPYLHPPCMLCNIEVMRQWPLPIKHGAPMTAAMLALHDAGRSSLVRHVDWTLNDVTPDTPKRYLDHIGRGTVTHTQGYHLEEWMAETQQKKQRVEPVAAAQGFNASLLALIPDSAKSLLEVGCSSGGLAQALKKLRPGVHFMGLELDPKAAEMARRHCDEVATFDIEQADEAHYRHYADRDCWIFGDVLEHLRDPWRVLSEIRKVLPLGACIVASIPNAQHWSVQARLTMGEFRYESTGLLDRTHLRWFTRITIFELFQSAGLRVEAGMPCIYPEPPIRERVLEGIRQMAIAIGRDPEGAVRDALPVQYVVRAVAA